MKKICFLSLLIFNGCATATSYNSDCFRENRNFQQAVECTKSKILNDPRSQGIVSYSKVNTLPNTDILFSYMNYVIEEVKLGKITEAEGQHLIHNKINALTQEKRISKKRTNFLGDAISHQNKTVYRDDECIGSVIMGECKGSIIDKGGHRPSCHGEWLNGECIGPIF